MERSLCALIILGLLVTLPSFAETVRLKATADVWLSDAIPQERDSSSGEAPRFKLKSIQEMAAVRFDASAAKGREVLKATLHLHTQQADNQLRYIRISTVNQDWKEGDGRADYGPGDGATFNHADHAAKKPWAWPGSQFCDVTFSSGQSLASWAERRKLDGGWISVDVAPELVYAMAVGDTDGLALQDGGTIKLFNNFVHSSESGRFAPYITVELGGRIDVTPAKPRVRAAPDPAHSHLRTGAMKLTIAPDGDVFCWRVKLGGEPVDRWRVKHPARDDPTTFSLEKLAPDRSYDLEVVAVSKGGQQSVPFATRVKSSAALAMDVALGGLEKPSAGRAPAVRSRKLRAWALPGLVKVSPTKAAAMYGDMGADAPASGSNAVWDGRTVKLFGIRGEYVDYQICIERVGPALKGVKITPRPLVGPGGAQIGGGEIELFRNWYSKTKGGKWQPAYPVPMKHGDAFDIPDPARGIRDQQNQTLYVDLYIPKDAVPGRYSGKVEVEAEGVESFQIPVELSVHTPLMPDKLAYWPEMNAYRIPKNHLDYWRLAHQHRCVTNFWVIRPQVSGAGADIRIDWDKYDRMVGPLLSGEAFKDNRRAGRPTECLYLPFEDKWPSNLTRENYAYKGHWPGRGEDRKHLVDHYLTSPYIGDALSQGYKDAFAAAQKQFVEHFRRKGWTNTEMQCFFGGKKTHRIDWGVNMWWTTDEPFHWDDWLALQFFDRLWTKGRRELGEPKTRWPARADISRPNWQGRVLDGITDTVYFGGFSNPRWYRRCRILQEDTGCKTMAYGAANAHDRSNTETVVLTLNMYLNGANGHLPWQTIGSKASLDKQEGTSGNALFVPGERFGVSVVGDMRLKAFRQGEQIVEYLVMVGDKYKLGREQLKAMVFEAVEIKTGRLEGASLDNADALTFSSMKAWQIKELRRRLLELLER